MGAATLVSTEIFMTVSFLRWVDSTRTRCGDHVGVARRYRGNVEFLAMQL
jgi:hypothetical protein